MNLNSWQVFALPHNLLPARFSTLQLRNRRSNVSTRRFRPTLRPWALHIEMILHSGVNGINRKADELTAILAVRGSSGQPQSNAEENLKIEGGDALAELLAT
jgi:hypothetical protein